MSAEQRLPPLKAEALRDQTIAAPGLAALDPQATLIVYAAALLAESDDGYTPEAAAGILLRARKITPEMMLAATQQITQQLGGAMVVFWNGFVASTWEGDAKPPSFVDPAAVARRKEAEEQEQERHRQMAAQVLANAQTAASALAIEDKEFPQPAPPPPAPKAPAFDVGKFLHGLVYKQPAPPPGDAPKAAPGWLTPPLIDPRDENIMIFENDIMDVVGARKLAGEQAWKKLDDRGYDRKRIVLAIDAARKIAQVQIAQCDQILAYIRSDYEKNIEPVVKAAAMLGHAVSVVNSFYSRPAPPPPAAPPPARPRGRMR